jgi:hypothetical protein
MTTENPQQDGHSSEMDQTEQIISRLFTVTHRYEHTTDFHWLEFPGKPDEATRAILKAEQWRWIGSAGQWRKAGLLTRLPELPDYTYEEAGAVDYSQERAEYYEGRADRAANRASAAHGRADRIADVIPFGQPILVGHHSERRHRRDLERIDRSMRTTIEESDKAERLRDRAEAAEQHARSKQSPGALARRLDTMRKQYRRYENATSEEGQRCRGILTAEIARLEQELEAAGGLAIDRITLQKGDLIVIEGHIVEVIRVNKKTITGYLAAPFHNLYDGSSRTKRSSGQHDRTRFGLRIYTASEWAEVNQGRTQAEAYAIAEVHLKEIRQARKAE